MTSPRPLSPEEWEQAQSSPVLSPQEWEAAQKPRTPLPKLGGAQLAGRGFAPDAVARIAGTTEPPAYDWTGNAWKPSMRRPGAVEQVLTGILGMPFAAAQHPLETAKAIALSPVVDPAKVGMYLAKKLNRVTGLPAPSERFDVSGQEATMSALNTAMMLAGSAKLGEAPKPIPEVVRTPRPGIGRVPASEFAKRLAQAEANRRGPAIPTAGDVPLNVPAAPTESAFPFGATTGDLQLGVRGAVKKKFTEPLPTPYATPGVRRLTAMPEVAKPLPEGTPVTTAATQEATALAEKIKAAADQPTDMLPPTQEAFPEGYSTASASRVRRPAGSIPSPQEWEALQREPIPAVPEPASTPKPLEPIPTIGEPVSFGRDLNVKGKEPTFNTGVALPDEAASVGKLPETPGRVPKMPPVPRVSAQTMLEVGKQRADALARVEAPTAMPDLNPAMVRTGQPLADPAAIPNPVKAPREFINYARINLDVAPEARLRSMVEGMRTEGTLGKTPMTMKEMAEQADIFKKQYLSSPLDLDRTKLASMSGIEAQGVKNLIKENSTLLEGLAKSLRSGELSPAEAADASAMFDKVTTQTKELLPSYVRAAQSSGQNLAAFRQDAKLSLDPDVWLIKAQKTLGIDKVMPDNVMIQIRRLAREAREACL